jgi:hypothetical protein
MGCPVLGPSSADQYLVRKLQHVGKRKKEMCSALHVGVSGGHCARGAEYLRSQFGQKGTSIDKTKRSWDSITVFLSILLISRMFAAIENA